MKILPEVILLRKYQMIILFYKYMVSYNYWNQSPRHNLKTICEFPPYYDITQDSSVLLDQLTFLFGLVLYTTSIENNKWGNYSVLYMYI